MLAPLYIAGLAQTSEEREALFALRMEVFVEEQKVPPEEEIDAYDITATHILARLASPPQTIMGAARLIDKGSGVGKIGRVAIHRDHRGRGAGAVLMRFTEAHAQEQGFRELILEAQTHALGFYERLGYVAEGDVFLDCNIPHRLMRKALS